MTTWRELTELAPGLARSVQDRFEATGLGFVATLRRDGSPRISGVEPLFALGELWLGMMDASRKAHDLLRDPRLALHSASADKEVADGDAKISGVAIDVGTEPELRRRYLEQFAETNGYAPDDAQFHLFRVDITGATLTRVEDDQLVVEWWEPDRGVQRIART